MAIANIQLIRQMKQLIPEPFRGLTDAAIGTNVAGIRAVAGAERAVVRGAAKGTRKASAYNRRFAKEYKRIKKAKPRSKHASIMRQAHKAARRKK